MADSEDPTLLFYTVVAVAKLGLGLAYGALFTQLSRHAHSIFHLPASLLAKNVSIACAIDPTVLFRQFSDTRCSRSPLFET